MAGLARDGSALTTGAAVVDQFSGLNIRVRGPAVVLRLLGRSHGRRSRVCLWPKTALATVC